MNRALVFSCLLSLALTGASIAGTDPFLFSQAPLLDEWGIYNAVPADKTCNSCTPTPSRAHAVAAPGYDGASFVVRINEVVVWGIYKNVDLEPGTPPAVDSFTVRTHGGGGLPGAEICSRTGIAGTREIVDTILGFDVYRHTLRLPSACAVIVPSNQAYWVELFNDTGPADDWFWLAGQESFFWPFDCCWPVSGYGTRVDYTNAPGSNWQHLFVPLPFGLATVQVGGVENLRLSTLPEGDLELQWAPDCGGGGGYSIYRGDLTTGYASLAPEPGLCDVTGTTAVVPAGEGMADFFLVAPWVTVGGFLWDPEGEPDRRQGSYGANSDGTTRPQPDARCYSKPAQTNVCAP